jgi:hypothetical protein
LPVVPSKKMPFEIVGRLNPCHHSASISNALIDLGENPEFVGALPPVAANGTIWHYLARFQWARIADLLVYELFTNNSLIQRYTCPEFPDQRDNMYCTSLFNLRSGVNGRTGFSDLIAHESFEGSITLRREHG